MTQIPLSRTGELPVPAELRVRDKLMRLARKASIEMTTRDPSEIEACADSIMSGADVYVSMPPGHSYHGQLAVAAAIRRAGFNPVPHVAARAFASQRMLEDCLARAAAEADVKKVLVIGGDRDRPAGPFQSSLDLLETGLFQKHGIHHIGVAAYPEGHPRLTESDLDRALAAKCEFARREGFTLHMVTQFCFDAAPIGNWSRRIRESGIDLPMRVGLAGPASITTLMRFAVRCGIGNSVRAIKNRGDSLVRLINEAGPDGVFRDLAEFAADQTAPVDIHLFSFGGFARTARWLRSVREGCFEFVANKPGFVVGRHP